jgi:hypothetical protein
MRMVWPFTGSKKRRGARRNSNGRTQRSPAILTRLALEPLEARRLLATITWSGAGDGTTWTSAANWIGNQVPGGNDSAVIGASSTTIKISGGVSVGSIVSGAPLNVSSSSFTVQSGTSQANNGLTISSGASLTATGAGTTFSATGTTVIDNASLYAENGANLTLPGVSTDTIPSGGGITLQANGSGSVLDLPNLTTINDQSSNFFGTLNIQAQNGGQVQLPLLTSITSNNTGITLDSEQSGSLLNLPMLAR